jgi:hypothetical protein
MQFDVSNAQLPEAWLTTASASDDNNDSIGTEEPELIVLATDNSRTVLLRSNLLSEGHTVRPFCPPPSSTMNGTTCLP